MYPAHSAMRFLAVFLVIVFFSGIGIFCVITWSTLSGSDILGSIQLSSDDDEDPPNMRLKEADEENQPPLIGDGDQVYIGNKHSPAMYPDASNSDGSLSKLSVVDEEKLMGSEDVKRVQQLKMKVITNLRRHLIDGGKVVGHINQYGVDFSQLPAKSKVNKKEIMCKLKRISLETVSESTSDLLRGRPFPNVPMLVAGNQQGSFSSGTGGGDSSSRQKRKPYRSCAVIPNSAAFDGAKHGLDIDSHEFVLRFNNAPTKGYEQDVGSSTSMRVVNSQVVTKPQFGFPYKRLATSTPTHKSFAEQNGHEYKAEGQQEEDNENLKPVDNDVLWSETPRFLIWDPCNFSATFEEWYKHPDFPLFEKYFRLMELEEQDRNRFHMLDCRAIWKLWKVLQEYSFAKIYGNPPTSGFIGIVLAMQNCERVNVYEYIPSARESARCHYYGPKDDHNPSCTYGSWHPVSAEKLFFLSLSDGTDKQIFMDGVLTIPGLPSASC